MMTLPMIVSVGFLIYKNSFEFLIGSKYTNMRKNAHFTWKEIDTVQVHLVGIYAMHIRLYK